MNTKFEVFHTQFSSPSLEAMAVSPALFVDTQASEEYLCAICLDVMTNPVQVQYTQRNQILHLVQTKPNIIFIISQLTTYRLDVMVVTYFVVAVSINSCLNQQHCINTDSNVQHATLLSIVVPLYKFRLFNGKSMTSPFAVQIIHQ